MIRVFPLLPPPFIITVIVVFVDFVVFVFLLVSVFFLFLFFFLLFLFLQIKKEQVESEGYVDGMNGRQKDEYGRKPRVIRIHVE